ncbi:MAG: lipoprotein [Xanthomonadaceae bacterium]|nr:lipoprotein [Xanthomonadaceae bacterium]MDE1964214.1 lipoprotein [Xanthomonadaceae bacterium]
MRRLLLPILAVLSATALAGCGNKGPLVLPARPATTAPAPAGSTAPAPATSTVAPAASR